MKKFTKKNILQKTIIVVLTVLSINLTIPTYSHAIDGGVLINPIIDFFATMADSGLSLLQLCMTGDSGASFSFTPNFLMEASDSYYEAHANDQYTQEEKDSAIKIDPEAEFEKGWDGDTNTYCIPKVTYSAEQIFAGGVKELDINFINPDKGKWGTTTDKEGNTVVDSSAGKLQPTISKWYIALRNLSVVGLLSVLVYVGIRIILSSNAGDKAKYKQMFMDWLIALCLVFFLHYIMSFIITITDSICQAIAGNGTDGIVVHDQSANTYFSTNLLGLVRFNLQSRYPSVKITYLVIYYFLIFYAAYFTFKYLYRMLMMAFLTLIAPLVALTYPIDKISDGKAQAFNAWFKEYLFNALLQPFHLIIYMIFVGTAMDIAGTNFIYMIATMAFMIPAEKILRKIFGFDKASSGTLGALGGFAAGTLLNKATGAIKKGVSSKIGGTGGKAIGEGQKQKTPRFEKKPNLGDVEGILPKGDKNKSTDKANNNINDKANNNIHDRAAEMLSEEEQNEKQELQNYFDNADYNEPFMNAEKYQTNLDRLQELEDKENLELESAQEPKEEKDASRNRGFRTGMSNWAKGHNITAGRVIKGVAKGATKGAFTIAGAQLGFLAGSLSGNMSGALIGLGTGGKVGNSAGEGVARATQGVYNMPGKIKRTINRERDLWNGNTELQDQDRVKEFKKNEDNRKYVSEMMAAQNGGVLPGKSELDKKMDSLEEYVKAGLIDIKDVVKAQKAETYGIKAETSAKIAAIAKDRGITADVLSDDKKCNALLKNMTHEYKDKKGLSDGDAKKIADVTLNIMKAQNGQAHNLKKSK